MADILNNIPGSNYRSSQFGDDTKGITVYQAIHRELMDFRDDFNAYSQEVLTYLKGNPSRASARQSGFSDRNNGTIDFRNPFGRTSRGRYGGSPFDRAMDSFEKSIFEAMGGANIKKRMQNSLKKFADDLGTDIEHLPEAFGDALGKYAANAFKSTKIGKKLTDRFNNLTNKFFDNLDAAYDRGSGRSSGRRPSGAGYKFSQSAFGGRGTGGGMGVRTNAAGRASRALTTTSSTAVAPSSIPIDMDSLFGATDAMGGFTEALGAVAPELLLVAKGAEILSAGFKWAFDDLEKGLEEFVSTLLTIATRRSEAYKKKVEAQQDRLMADVRTLIEEPFNILKSAAEEIYDVWDSQLRTITATQGYSKADLQDLMAVYAERIRNEGLSSVVSGADITSNLAKVLESGLSGAVAEEFAYLATILNAAIPTQDFFEYATTYASLAANLMASGKTQEEAIKAANKELNSFASSILYTNRTLTGGFSAGLKDASDLFTKAVQITQAAKTGSASNIAGVLTAVAGITGALAPDLASSMVDSIVKAATGGNASEIVALRSLAGVNASNTEFLRQLAQNPQQIFSTLFTNLARMQNMSNDAFMEVAEGLSSVFGISMESFARLDFTQLAQSIQNMDTSMTSLEQNIQLLASGQSTSTAEQLKIQQINQYMIEEGLSYVVDNAAARMIQEHMWDEQIARQITENTYAVELTGASEKLLASLAGFGEKVLTILSLGLYGAQNIEKTRSEFNAQREVLAMMLIAGKVGNGGISAKVLSNAIDTMNTYNKFGASLSLNDISSGFDSQLQNLLTYGEDIKDVLFPGIIKRMTKNIVTGSSSAVSPSSKYSWGTVSKSLASALLGQTYGGGYSAGSVLSTSATASAAAGLKSKLDSMLTEEYMRTFTQEGGGGFEAWKESARKLGISDLDAAIESAGYTSTEFYDRYNTQQVQEVAQREAQRKQKEEDFWDNTLDYHTQMLSYIDTMGKTVQDIYTKHSEFFTAWGDYYIRHTEYNKGLDMSVVNKILDGKDKDTSDAIYALADALVQAKDLDDPQLQTNVLLAQILNLVQIMMTKQSNTPSFSLGDTLQSLGMGILST